VSRLLALLLVAVAAGCPAALAAEPRASLPDIEDEVMCTVCGTTLELSESPQAERERALIRRLIDRGLSKEEIKDELVVEYGPDVLAVPEDEGFDLVAWLVPIAGLLLALAAIAGYLLGRRRRGPPQARSRELDAADRQRLSEDMSRYEL
jgi:cytochrome c-type biogenesis protein CcmH